LPTNATKYLGAKSHRYQNRVSVACQLRWQESQQQRLFYQYGIVNQRAIISG
jgi:hypothetical protein